MADRRPSAIFLIAAFGLFLLVTEAARIESISATVDRKVKHETFVPLVAFKCGYRNKFMNESGEWQDDASSLAVCLEGKLDILKYCKRVYPDRKITNIVEYNHISHISSWCKESSHGCNKDFFTRPWRCIEGEFIADSLQVPSKCKFGHVSGRETCDDYNHWSKKAEAQCGDSLDDHDHKSMKLHSFAMLEPCGLSLFRGVEYVCCPKSVENEYKVDEYSETDDDDEESDDDDDETEESDSKSSDTQEEDPYFTDDEQANEHDRYRDAQERLEKKYRAKVTKIITEWSELFERYNQMRKKDPEGAEKYKSEMTERFRKTVSSLEDENKDQRRQLEERHDERVQAALNEKKRKATHAYRMELAIQVGHVNKQNVLRTLKDYIKAEEKDRIHMLNRYRHLLHSNSDAAAAFEPMLLHRLRYIDLRINGTLAMLRDFPDLEKEIRPAAEEFWRSYRHENTPEIDGKLMEVDDTLKDNNDQLVQMYKDATEKKTKPTRPQSSFHQAAKESRKNGELKTKFVPLKDIIGGGKKETYAKDSDEDEYEEDDEAEELDKSSNDEQIETSPIVVNETVLAEKKAEKLAEDQKLAKERHAHKLALERGIELQEPKQPIKAFDLSKAKPVEKEELDDGNDADTEDDNEESDDETQDIDIDERLFVRKEVEPAYARHDKLFADGVEPQQSTDSFWNSTPTVLIYSTMVLCLLAVAAIVLRHRTTRQGFIEVDVVNPDEDYHTNKMQVNGYENPTYYYTDKP